ncbi:hypothetical protein [Stutzerimonas urumqiensis]|uniref:hypothetical protein n=1 Tax=Stutzerimonas urumqiensis TaxID=638269 RepID=UPI003BA94F95
MLTVTGAMPAVAALPSYELIIRDGHFKPARIEVHHHGRHLKRDLQRDDAARLG